MPGASTPSPNDSLVREVDRRRRPVGSNEAVLAVGRANDRQRGLNKTSLETPTSRRGGGSDSEGKRKIPTSGIATAAEADVTSSRHRCQERPWSPASGRGILLIALIDASIRHSGGARRPCFCANGPATDAGEELSAEGRVNETRAMKDTDGKQRCIPGDRSILVCLLVAIKAHGVCQAQKVARLVSE